MGPAVWETAGQDKVGREGVDYLCRFVLRFGFGLWKVVGRE